MRFELKRLQRELGITTVYVTHDQSEALALSHSIAVMNRGQIQQTGTPREVYERPGNQFVADFIGTTNFLRATVKAADGTAGFYRVASEVGELKVRAVDALEQGMKVVISVRPEDIRLSETKVDEENLLEGTVDTKVFLGESVDFQVKVKERNLLARAHPSLGTRVGHPIYLSLNPEKCVGLKETAEWTPVE
jgi:iron(III) transport system ATP-binding protein